MMHKTFDLVEMFEIQKKNQYNIGKLLVVTRKIINIIGIRKN